MRLSCPGCGEQVLAGPPTVDRPPGRPTSLFRHTHGTPLCPTPTLDGSCPHGPDDHDPHPQRVIATITADTLAAPKAHPCCARGGVPAPVASATVLDKQGGINCSATIAAARCRYGAAGMLDRNGGGLQAAGCWLKVAAPQAAITALHLAGVALPHRVPGFAHQRLDRNQIQALVTWLRRHHDTYLDIVPPRARPDAAAVLRQTVDWLSYTATTAGGLRTVRADPGPHRPAGRPAAGVVGMNTLLWIAVLLAAILATAILTRRRGTPGHAVDTAIRAAAGLTTVGLAGIAAAISYQHLLTLAVEQGQTQWRASAFPLSVDGLELVSSLVLLADRRAARRSGWLPWAALGAGAIASLFANIAVAEHNWIARTIAGWPALALIIAIKLLSGLLEHAATPPPSTVDTAPGPHEPAAANNPAPDVPDA